MRHNELLKELCIDNLQEQHKGIAEIIGIDALIKLSDYYGGTQIYVPQTFELLKELKYKKISEEFDGNNIQQLAIKYKVSESTVYRIVRDRIAEIKRAPFEGQITLF